MWSLTSSCFMRPIPRRFSKMQPCGPAPLLPVHYQHFLSLAGSLDVIERWSAIGTDRDSKVVIISPRGARPLPGLLSASPYRHLHPLVTAGRQEDRLHHQESGIEMRPRRSRRCLSWLGALDGPVSYGITFTVLAKHKGIRPGFVFSNHDLLRSPSLRPREGRNCSVFRACSSFSRGWFPVHISYLVHWCLQKRSVVNKMQLFCLSSCSFHLSITGETHLKMPFILNSIFFLLYVYMHILFCKCFHCIHTFMCVCVWNLQNAHFEQASKQICRHLSRPTRSMAHKRFTICSQVVGSLNVHETRCYTLLSFGSVSLLV